MKKYNISIISPFPIVRDGLEGMVKEEKGFSLGMVANDYAQAMQLVKESDSDIVVANISPLLFWDIKLIKDIRKRNLPLLVYSECDKPYYVASCLKEGANGYVLTTEPAEKIVEAIRTVLKGGKYVSDEIVHIAALDELVYSFTPREFEVFEKMCQGLGDKDIKKSLGIKAIGTVKTYNRRIKDTLGFKEMSELRRYAVQYAIRKARSGMH